MGLPLQGILVLDFSEYIAGPYCGALLGDLGAEVIKIEPIDGAEERRLGNRKRYRGNTRLSLGVNRGKKSLAVDLQKSEGREIVYRLVERADITIQNFAPGAAAKLGIDYETLREHNGRLIFISSTAYGETGPYGKRKGFDIIAHAASGIMSYYADERGNPRGPGGLAYIDMATGILSVTGALAALIERERTGEGQKLETSLFNTGMAFQTPSLVNIDGLDKAQRQEESRILQRASREGKGHTDIIDVFAELRLRNDQPDTDRPVEVPDCRHRPSDRRTYPYYRVYQTADGYIAIAALNRTQRYRVCDTLGVVDEGADVEIGNIPDQLYYRQKELMSIIERKLLTRTNQEWIGIFQAAGVPCGQVNYRTHMFDDPQALAVDMIWRQTNSVVGPCRVVGHPVQYSKTPIKATEGAPALGEQTDGILERLGCSVEKIAELRKDGVVG